jgi:hypothetical protein
VCSGLRGGIKYFVLAYVKGRYPNILINFVQEAEWITNITVLLGVYDTPFLISFLTEN